MDEDIHIGKQMFNFCNKLKRKIGNEASKYGVTSVQARILGFLYHKSNKKDIFQKDIEEELDIRRSSVTSVLQLMEKNGYIERVSVCEDARLKKITLTDNGLEIQKNVHNHILGIEKMLRDELSDAEMNMLMNLINRLSKKITD